MHRAHTLVLAALISVPLSAADIAPTGTLRAAFLRTNPVQGRIDPRTGGVSGPVADLVQALARQLGVPYKILPAANGADVIARLKAHTADIGFLAYDAPRAAEVDFSEPYALMLNTYIVPADSSIRKSSDVDRAGVRVGVVGGQSQEVVLKQILKKAEVKVLAASPPVDELGKMLASGEMDAYGANRQRLIEAAARDPKLRVLPDNFSVAEQCIVVAKEDAARLDAINQFLEKARTSGLVKASLERAKLTAGVEVASGRRR
jgi:polar amino acid transport system substrate-binding protein